MGKEKGNQFDTLGVLVQFSWEASLLITGIRASGFGPLIVDSLIETNLGMPYLYFLYLLITKHFTEDLKLIKQKDSLLKQLEDLSLLDKVQSPIIFEGILSTDLQNEKKLEKDSNQINGV